MARGRGQSEAQMPLGGFAAPSPSDRLFFAIYPDAEAALRIVELANALHKKHRLRGSPLRADRVHITLHYLGDHAGLPGMLVDAASAAATRLAVPSFEVGFDCVATFAGHARKRPCVLRCLDEHANAPLREFQRRLGQQLRLGGMTRDAERSFMPHVTLLYDERALAPETVAPVGWKVREFALIHSLLGKSEHRVLNK